MQIDTNEIVRRIDKSVSLDRNAKNEVINIINELKMDVHKDKIFSMIQKTACNVLNANGKETMCSGGCEDCKFYPDNPCTDIEVCVNKIIDMIKQEVV